MVWEATTKQESTTFGRYWSFRKEKEGSCDWIAGPSPAMTILFFLLSSSGKRSAFRGSLDIRDKPEYDIKKNKPEQDYKEK